MLLACRPRPLPRAPPAHAPESSPRDRLRALRVPMLQRRSWSCCSSSRPPGPLGAGHATAWPTPITRRPCRSMAGSWHNFLYNSFDVVRSADPGQAAAGAVGQALRVRVFGFSSWAMLVPQALMGVGTVALAYDMTRRVFGRPARLRGRPGPGADADHGRDLAPQQPGRAGRAVLDRGAVVHGARGAGRQDQVVGLGRA